MKKKFKKKYLFIISGGLLFLVVGLIVLLVCLVNKSVVLDAPYISLTNNELSISKVSNATKYNIYINEELKDTIVKNTYELSYDIEGEFNIYVISTCDNKKYLDSDKSNELIYKVYSLNTPTITKDDRYIRWDSVDGAKEYEIYLDNQLFDTTIDSEYYLDLDNITHSISVKAIGNNKNIKDSEISESISYKQLTSPILNDNGSYIYWTNISNSDKYIVYVDGTKYELEEARIDIPSSRGLHEIQVSYVGKNEYSSSNLSNKYYIEIYEKLEKITDLSIDGDYFKWSIVDNAVGYELEFNDGETVFTTQTTTNTFYYKDINFGSYDVTIKALGNSNRYFDDSEKSESIRLNYLPPLSSPVITLTGYQLTWNLVSNAIGYDIYNGENLLIEGVSAVSYDLRSITKTGYYYLTVVAKGDMVNYSDSLKSNEEIFLVSNRLSTPTFNISGNNLEIEQVDGASGYYICIDGVRYKKTTNTSYSLEGLEEGSYILTVVAYNDDKNLYEDSYSSDETRYIVEGIENDVANGIASFDTISYVISGKNFDLECSNTPITLEGDGYTFDSKKYIIGYLINRTNLIKLSISSNANIRIIYYSNENSSITLDDEEGNVIYEVVGVTSIGFDLTPTMNNALEGEYYITASNDTYILAIIVDGTEEDITYLYKSYSKASYLSYVDSYDEINSETGLSIYDNVVKNVIDEKKEYIKNQINNLNYILEIEEKIEEFDEFVNTLVTKDYKEESVELVESMDIDEDKKARIINQINASIYLSELEYILDNLNN